MARKDTLRTQNSRRAGSYCSTANEAKAQNEKQKNIKKLNCRSDEDIFWWKKLLIIIFLKAKAKYLEKRSNEGVI